MTTESLEAAERVDSDAAVAEKPRRFQLTLKSPPKTPKPVAVAGRVPQVSLLPRDLHASNRGRGLRIALVAAVVVSAGAVGAAVVYANGLSGAASEQVATAQSATTALNAQLVKFAPMEKLQQQITLGTAAVRVGSSTAIDWQAKIQQIVNSMPSGWSVTSVGTSGATPFADYPQGTSALDVARVATISITASAPSIAALPTWLAALPAVRGYADATPTVSKATAGTYQVTVLVHLTDAAYITQLNQEAAK